MNKIYLLSFIFLIGIFGIGIGSSVECNADLNGTHGYGEGIGMEFGHKNFAPEDTKRYKNMVADVIQNNPPLPSDMANRQEFLDIIQTGARNVPKAFK